MYCLPVSTRNLRYFRYLFSHSTRCKTLAGSLETVKVAWAGFGGQSPDIGVQTMRGKEFAFAMIFTLAGAALALGAYLALGDSVSPVVFYALLVIGLGAALVTVRIGRIGPFGGELGSLR